jgi:membrane-anchored glycerophosphoryl diester phosphodiesterase (GDPDase)
LVVFSASLEATGYPPAEVNTVILFIEKTWFLWWMLAIILALRWFHLSTRAKMEAPDAVTSEEKEQEAYILSWRILHKTQVISLFETKS